MSETAVLYKVLEVKEQEKEEAQLRRIKAVEKFEEVANQLYEQLLKKENAEEHLNLKMKDTFTIDKMIAQTRYINNLAKKVMTLQSYVQQARTRMDTAQEQLNEAHIEVKKIEKMIEIREKELEAETRLVEANLMDEMSIRQYNKQSQNR